VSCAIASLTQFAGSRGLPEVIDTAADVNRESLSMIKFRHLIWTIVATIGLVLSASQSFAQQNDPGDQRGA
jgi:hypothetical protein